MKKTKKKPYTYYRKVTEGTAMVPILLNIATLIVGIILLCARPQSRNIPSVLAILFTVLILILILCSEYYEYRSDIVFHIFMTIAKYTDSLVDSKTNPELASKLIKWIEDVDFVKALRAFWIRPDTYWESFKRDMGDYLSIEDDSISKDT